MRAASSPEDGSLDGSNGFPIIFNSFESDTLLSSYGRKESRPPRRAGIRHGGPAAGPSLRLLLCGRERRVPCCVTPAPRCDLRRNRFRGETQAVLFQMEHQTLVPRTPLSSRLRTKFVPGVLARVRGVGTSWAAEGAETKGELQLISVPSSSGKITGVVNSRNVCSRGNRYQLHNPHR